MVEELVHIPLHHMQAKTEVEDHICTSCSNLTRSWHKYMMNVQYQVFNLGPNLSLAVIAQLIDVMSVCCIKSRCMHDICILGSFNFRIKGCKLCTIGTPVRATDWIDTKLSKARNMCRSMSVICPPLENKTLHNNEHLSSSFLSSVHQGTCTIHTNSSPARTPQSLARNLGKRIWEQGHLYPPGRSLQSNGNSINSLFGLTTAQQKMHTMNKWRSRNVNAGTTRSPKRCIR